MGTPTLPVSSIPTKSNQFSTLPRHNPKNTKRRPTHCDLSSPLRSSTVTPRIRDEWPSKQKRIASLRRLSYWQKKRAARTAKKAYKAQGKAFIAVASKQGDVCADGFTIE